MTEYDLEQHLCELFGSMAYRAADDDEPELDVSPELYDPDQGIARVDSFDDAGVLTRSAGLVVRTRDGAEFQITVVRSR